MERRGAALVAEPNFVAKLLSVVAFYVCIDLCVKLVKGTRRVRGETAAAADCPLSLAELNALRARLGRMRDTILHLGDIDADGSGVRVDSRHDPDPVVTISATDEGRRANKTEEITVGDIERLLDAIDPWLKRHFDRLVMDYARSR